MPGIKKDIDEMGRRLHTHSLRETLTLMADAQLIQTLNEADRDDDCRLDFQAVLRYPDATDPENDYWNVFVYPLCNGGFEYCWQHCMDESNDIDDYGTITCDTPEALLKALFYRQDCDTTDGDPDYTALEHIWVD
jgi:hypothetical protein